MKHMRAYVCAVMVVGWQQQQHKKMDMEIQLDEEVNGWCPKMLTQMFPVRNKTRDMMRHQKIFPSIKVTTFCANFHVLSFPSPPFFINFGDIIIKRQFHHINQSASHR